MIDVVLTFVDLTKELDEIRTLFDGINSFGYYSVYK